MPQDHYERFLPGEHIPEIENRPILRMWLEGNRKLGSRVVRLVRASIGISEGIPDRHVAKYLLYIIRAHGRCILNQLAIKLLKNGKEDVAYYLVKFWDEFTDRLLKEASKKPELHPSHWYQSDYEHDHDRGL